MDVRIQGKAEGEQESYDRKIQSTQKVGFALFILLLFMTFM